MALAVEVVLEADLDGRAGFVEHSLDGIEWRRLAPEAVTTDLTAAISFALVPSGGVRVRVERQAPYCSGIGGSSSYGIALATALGHLRGSVLGEERLVALIRDLEARVLRVPTGEQDHWAAVRGGVLTVHLDPGGNRIEMMDVSPSWLAERATVFYSGITHRSGMVNWQVIRRRLDREARTTRAFSEIATAAQRCRRALLAGDEAGVATAIRSEWAARRRLAPEVCPPELEDLVEIALGSGATAVKACGAGGGGSLLVWHPVGARTAVVAALDAAAHGGYVLAAGAAGQGCRLLRDL
jgi:D-glycero-alpha-D-manno-heptose-7-phosphate kinase